MSLACPKDLYRHATATGCWGTGSTHVTDAIFSVGFNYRFPP